MPHDRTLLVIENEDGEAIGSDEISEIESLFADILFDAWLQTKSASLPPAVQAKGAA